MVIKKQKSSVLLVNYNQSKHINSLIPVLKSQIKGVEILVFDNSQNYKNKHNIKVYSLNKNIGFGNAINYLATKAKGDYFFILNSDIKIIKNLNTALTKFKKTKINYYVFSLGKAEKLYFVPFLTKFTKNKRFSGYAFLTHKNFFKGLGGFNPHLFMYFEDDSFAIEAAKFNLKVKYPKNAFVKHKKDYKNTTNKLRKGYYYDSLLFFLHKYKRPWYYLFLLPIKTIKLFYK